MGLKTQFNNGGYWEHILNYCAAWFSYITCDGQTCFDGNGGGTVIGNLVGVLKPVQNFIQASQIAHFYEGRP